MESLHTDGYALFRKILTPHEIEQGSSIITKDQVEYTKMTSFIQSTLLPRASKQMGADWNLTHTKYRVSNNNNSDAGAFHRDVVCLGEWIPVLTCLTYFDKTVMELIPGSHRILSASYLDAPSMFSQRISIPMEPGDVLLFYSTLLHRGIFTGNTNQRRLIQVFDCFQDAVHDRKYSRQLIHVMGDTSAQSSFLAINKMPLITDISNYYGFLNAVTGYGGEKGLTICELEGRNAFSSEGFCGRLTVIPNTIQTINQYILSDKPRFDLPASCCPAWKWELYNKIMILYMILTACMLSCIIYGLVFVYQRYMKRMIQIVMQRVLRIKLRK